MVDGSRRERWPQSGCYVYRVTVITQLMAIRILCSRVVNRFHNKLKFTHLWLNWICSSPFDLWNFRIRIGGISALYVDGFNGAVLRLNYARPCYHLQSLWVSLSFSLLSQFSLLSVPVPCQNRNENAIKHFYYIAPMYQIQLEGNQLLTMKTHKLTIYFTFEGAKDLTK